jgi:hypothetical protein
MQPGITYTLECYAYNGANDPSARLSLVAQITGHVAAGDTTAPGQVTGLTLTDHPPRGIRAAWNDLSASVNDFDRYQVDVADNSGFSTNLRTFHVDSNELPLTNLTNGATQYVRVRALDKSKNAGSFSSTASRTVPRVATNDINNDQVDTDKRQDMLSQSSEVTVSGNNFNQAIFNFSPALAKTPVVVSHFAEGTDGAVQACVANVTTSVCTLNLKNNVAGDRTRTFVIRYW